MAQPLTLEGTWDEIAAHVEELRGKRLRIQVIADAEAVSPDAPQTLEELMGDYVGCISSGGGSHSENTGEQFAEYLLEKQRDGRL